MTLFCASPKKATCPVTKKLTYRAWCSIIVHYISFVRLAFELEQKRGFIQIKTPPLQAPFHQIYKMQSHNRSLSSAMISHDLQDWLTRTSAEPAPLPRCCCEQSTCASSELFHDTIKRLEGESRLAAGTFISCPPPSQCVPVFFSSFH